MAITEKGYWTHKDVKQAVELRRQGLSLRAIAARMGRCRRQLMLYLRKYGGEAAGRAKDGLPEHRTRLLEMVARKMTVAQIAVALNVRQGSVRRWLVRLSASVPSGRLGRKHSAATIEKIAAAKYERERARCARLGWPQVSLPLFARVLEVLYRRGPLTHPQLAQALGWKLYSVGPTRAPRNPSLAARVTQMIRLRYVVKAHAGDRTYLYSVSPWLVIEKEAK